jgi:hypothetical protein
MKHLQIEFEKGGVFSARLFEEQAPKTCRKIIKRLPLEFTFWQSIVSGHAMVTLPENLTVEPENQRTIGCPAGTLAFLVQDPPRNVPDEIYIAYGPYFVSRCSYIEMQQPVNVFAQIEDNLDELQEVGKRVLMQGAEKVKITVQQ